MRRVIVMTLLLGAALGSTARPAGAFCATPYLDPSLVRGELLRGQEVVVHGTGFGRMDGNSNEECPLGTPYQNIEIVFAQEGEETLVARGIPDEDYGFLLEVVVPSKLRPGPALVGVRLPDFDDLVGAFQVTIADVRAPAQDGPVRYFGKPPARGSGGVGRVHVALGAVALAGALFARRFA